MTERSRPSSLPGWNTYRIWRKRNCSLSSVRRIPQTSSQSELLFFRPSVPQTPKLTSLRVRLVAVRRCQQATKFSTPTDPIFPPSDSRASMVRSLALFLSLSSPFTSLTPPISRNVPIYQDSSPQTQCLSLKTKSTSPSLSSPPRLPLNLSTRLLRTSTFPSSRATRRQTPSSPTPTTLPPMISTSRQTRNFRELCLRESR